MKIGTVAIVDSRQETLRLAKIAAAEYLLSLLEEGVRQVRARIQETRS